MGPLGLRYVFEIGVSIYEKAIHPMETKNHWERVFETKAITEVSWYKPHLDLSLELIARSGAGPGDTIIDVGGGDSSLADDLLRRGFSDITVLDIAASALHRARERLGDLSGRVRWLETDILTAELAERRYDVWHDRAAFHFLVDEAARLRYRTQLERSLKSGGHLILATFADDGPKRCSGLQTMQYSAETLTSALGRQFHLLESHKEAHVTPAGKEQRFVYCLFRREAP